MEFNINGFLLGVAIIVVGVLLLKYYKEIADNLASGVSSYDKIRIWGVGLVMLGLGVSFGIVQFLLIELLSLFFPSIR